MSNMSYCRWENTLADLHDCADNLHDDLMGDEARARTKLVELAREMVNDWDINYGEG